MRKYGPYSVDPEPAGWEVMPSALLVVWAISISPAITAIEFESKTTTLWAPCLEWSLLNATYVGNPHDVVARVVFSHVGGTGMRGGEKRTTEMFYVGKGVWKFRFTGTRTGRWRFRTVSDDPDLDGHFGTVSVSPNERSTLRGFLTSRGNKYAIKVGGTGELRGYLFNVYMDRVCHAVFERPNKLGGDYRKHPVFRYRDVSRIRSYLNDTRANGFEVIFVHPAYPFIWVDGASPRLELFEVLETMITTAHGVGMRVHLWMWGDGSRGATPRHGGMDGINGTIDRRLQRYIAARLGPLPGWTLGYGFDLHEWVDVGELNEWARFMHAHFGWQHLLSARGQRLEGSHNIASYDGFGRPGVPLATTRGGPADYREVLEDLNALRGQPHLYEERHSYRRKGFKLDMAGTRRLLWWQAMAGGMGGFYGFYPGDEHPYPRPEQLRTHHAFWHEHARFILDMTPANELTDGMALMDASKKRLVFYKEDTSSMWVGQGGATALPAVAVDTRVAYVEIDLGVISRQRQMIRFPRRSDWAIAVGDFRTQR